MVRRSEVRVVEPLYRCPYCYKRFYSYLSLYNHVRCRHGILVITNFQYQVLLACRKLTINGKEWFCFKDVYDQFVEMFKDAKRSRLRERIKNNLFSLTKMRLLEMKRMHNIIHFRLRR